MSTDSKRFGRYWLIKCIGAGGMGEVHLAKLKGPSGFEKLVVIKRLLQNRRNEQRFVDMFFSEARVTAQLNHANIVQIYEVEYCDTVPYIAMEYVRGKSLRIVLDVLRKRGGPKGTPLPRLPRLPAYYIVQIFSELCSGLAFAHDARHLSGATLGLIHRDINPHNVLITYRGEVKLIDFGIAKSELTLDKTQAGTIKGTVIYMSPEQSSGRKLDRRSDMFAVGICLYEILTGSNPFHKDNMAASLEAIRHADVPALDTTNPEAAVFQEIISRSLAKNPGDRYTDCEQMRQALQRLLRDGKVAPLEVSLADYLQQLFAPEIDEEARLLSQTEIVQQADFAPAQSMSAPPQLHEEPTRALGPSPAALADLHTLADLPLKTNLDGLSGVGAAVVLPTGSTDVRATQNLGPVAPKQAKPSVPQSSEVALPSAVHERDASTDETNALFSMPAAAHLASAPTTGRWQAVKQRLKPLRQPRSLWLRQPNSRRLALMGLSAIFLLAIVGRTVQGLFASPTVPVRSNVGLAHNPAVAVALHQGAAGQQTTPTAPMRQATSLTADPPSTAPGATVAPDVAPPPYSEEVHIDALADAPPAAAGEAAGVDSAAAHRAPHRIASARHHSRSDRLHPDAGDTANLPSLQIGMEPTVSVLKDGVVAGRRISLRGPAGVLQFGPTGTAMDASKFSIKVRYHTSAKTIAYTIESEPWANVYGAGGIALGRTPIKDMAGDSTTVLEFKNPRLPDSQRIILHFAPD